jgi:hypothetical protein
VVLAPSRGELGDGREHPSVGSTATTAPMARLSVVVTPGKTGPRRNRLMVADKSQAGQDVHLPGGYIAETAAVPDASPMDMRGDSGPRYREVELRMAG